MNGMNLDYLLRPIGFVHSRLVAKDDASSQGSGPAKRKALHLPPQTPGRLDRPEISAAHAGPHARREEVAGIWDAQLRVVGLVAVGAHRRELVTIRLVAVEDLERGMIERRFVALHRGSVSVFMKARIAFLPYF